MAKDYYSKQEVIDYVWQHSRYYGNLLSYCEQRAVKGSGNGTAALILLFNLTANIFKDRIKNYDAKFVDIISDLKSQQLISQTEYTFLNDRNNSIRKLQYIII